MRPSTCVFLVLAACASCATDDDSTDESALTGAVTTGPTFNNPNGTQAEQDAIVDHLANLIDGAPSGSRIQLSSFTFGTQELATKLVAAKQRGVTVQIVLDHTSVANGEGKKVYPTLKGIGTYTGDDNASWTLVCAANHACFAEDQDNQPSVNHNKFYLFSRTSGTPNDFANASTDVVVQTSANLTTWDRVTAFNDALTVVANTDLFKAYQTYFGKLRDAGAGKIARTSNYDVAVEAGPNAKVYYFPRNGNANDDVVVDILNTIDNPVGTNKPCHGNKTGIGTANGRTIVRVAMHQLDRIAVAQKLWDLQNEGCEVQIVYAQLDATGHAVADELAKNTAFGHLQVSQLSGRRVVHSKYMIVEGTYDGHANQKIVFTGSHTYTASALHSNDETLLKYDNANIFDTYRTHFNTVRAAVPSAAQ